MNSATTEIGSTGDHMDIEELVWRRRFAQNLASIIPKDKSLREISSICGTDPSSLSAYLSGTRIPSAYSIVKIARGLGCSISTVIDFFY